MRKILHVIAGNLFGGVESFLVSLAKSGSQKRGVEHHYSICYEGRFSTEIEETGCQVNIIGPARISNPIVSESARRKLRAVIGKTQPEVIVCHMGWAQILFGGVGTNGRPWIAHHHGPPGKNWVDWLSTLRKPKSIISPSRHSSISWGKKYGRNVEILNYPVRPEFCENDANSETNQGRAVFNLPEGKVLILQCSRFESWKGHDILLEALGKIRLNESWHMVFAGSPQKQEDLDYFNFLIEQSNALKINDRITWAGNIKDVAALMRCCDIYCQANRGPEGFSLSFLEAAFSGLPIVTTDLGGAPEIVEENGFLIPTPDPKLFADSLTKLIENPEIRNIQSEASRMIGQRKGDPLTQIGKYEKMCLSLCDNTCRV